jgi:hypothetical protein
MVLDSMDRMNITDLTLHSPELHSESGFDINEFITPENWAKMKAELKDFRDEGDLSGFIRLASGMKLAFPERAEELDEFKTYAAANFHIPRFVALPDERLMLDWQRLELLYPGAFVPDLRETREDLVNRHIRKVINGARNVLDNREVLDILVRIKLLFPDQYDNRELRKHFTTELWHKTAANLEAYRQQQRWMIFAETAANAAIVFPTHEWHSLVTPEDWREMEKRLVEFKERVTLSAQEQSDFISMAGQMRLLTAEKVDITDGKLDVVYPSQSAKIREEQDPFPNERVF